MTVHRKVVVLLLLLLVVFGGCLFISRPHWLMPHGRVTCAGQAVVGARVYRSQQGDVFVYAPNLDIQVAVVSPKNQDLGRCNSIHSCIRVAVQPGSGPNCAMHLDVEGWWQH